MREVGLFRMRQFRGNLNLKFMEEKRFITVPSRRPYFKETLALKNTGFIINPRVIDLEWRGDLDLSQERYISSTYNQYSAGKFISNYLAGSVFKHSSYPSVFVFNRYNNLLEIDYGGRSLYDVNKYQASFLAQELFLPSSLRLESRETKEEWSRGIWTTRREQLRRTINYSGRRRSETSYFDLYYNLRDLKDYLVRDRSYRTQNTNIRFQRSFGENLDNNWDSNIRLYTRVGRTRYKSAKATQILQLSHPYGFSSLYRYNFSATQTNLYSSLLHRGFVSLNHKLFQSLNTTAGIGGLTGTITNGKERAYSYNYGIHYNKRVPFSGNFQIGYDKAFSLNDRQVSTTVQTVVNEQHAFISGLPIFLNERNVIVSTIVIYNEQGDIFYEEGVDRDYTIQVVGDVVEIFRNPLGRIEENQMIVVDYQFKSMPSLKYSTNTTIFNTSLSFEWLSFYYRVNNHDQTPFTDLGEEKLFLQDLYTKTFGSKLSWRSNTSGLSFFIERKRQISTLFAYRSLDIRQAFYVQPTRTMLLSSSLTLSLLDHSRLDRTLKVYSYHSELQWDPTTRFSMRCFGRIRMRHETAKRNEASLEFGSVLNWYWRIMSLRLSYEYQRWDYGPRQIKVRRFTIELKRAF